VIRWPRNGVGTGVAAVMLLASAPGLVSQRGGMDLTVETPASLAQVADRVRHVDRQQLAGALARAGLNIPPQIHVTLIPENDPRARVTPVWIVGLASGSHDILIFPGRIGSYPYDSLESVVWHEVVHLALSAQAGDRPLPRWFHEGVAMSLEKGWGVTSQGQLLLATGGNPGLSDLGRLFDSETQPETAGAYLLAAALVSDMRQRHGAATPGAIVDRISRGALFAHAFALETGETPDEAAAHAWQVYRRWTNWIPVVTSASSLWAASWRWRWSPFWPHCASGGGAGVSGTRRRWTPGRRRGPLNRLSTTPGHHQTPTPPSTDVQFLHRSGGALNIQLGLEGVANCHARPTGSQPSLSRRRGIPQQPVVSNSSRPHRRPRRRPSGPDRLSNPPAKRRSPPDSSCQSRSAVALAA